MKNDFIQSTHTRIILESRSLFHEAMHMLRVFSFFTHSHSRFIHLPIITKFISCKSPLEHYDVLIKLQDSLIERILQA